MLLIEVPIASRATMAATATRAAIRPYSIMVAPDSSSMKAFRCFNISILLLWIAGRGVRERTQLRPVVRRGEALFHRAGCAACPPPPTFALAANSRSNGLDAGETRLFKAPSLRSVGLTGPYMHDGRFTTLDQVLERQRVNAALRQREEDAFRSSL